MGTTGVQRAKTRQQIQSELLEGVQRAKAEFQQATADNRAAARESYVRALDALNTFLRSEKIPGCA
jgi:hypothetical protein